MKASPLLLLSLILFLSNAWFLSCRPNIIFILTDDQDVTSGSLDVMTKTKELLKDKGVFFSNAMVTTPVCCPSRSSILTGRYQHNHGVVNNSKSGNCSSQAWVKNNEPHSIATYLSSLGYKTAFFGKYMNDYSNSSHVPVGWDHWFALMGNSVYYNYSISDNGKRVKHTDKYPQDYLPLVLENAVFKFLNQQVPPAAPPDQDQPFFVYLATPSPHRPSTPEPKFENMFPDHVAPRVPSFNFHSDDKHWMVRTTPVMNDTVIEITDTLYRERLRTLLTVDIMVERIVAFLEEKALIDDTFIVFTSDNGYHLGHYCLQGEKRQPYENELRVPMIVRGPGVPEGKVVDSVVLNIDIAPTLTEMGGRKIPQAFDGESFFSLLFNQTASDWRTDFVIEYHGEHGLKHNDSKNHTVVDECFLLFGFVHDCPNNTYRGLRLLNQSENWLYAEWITGFQEIYDIGSDKFQLVNAINSTHPLIVQQFQQRIRQLGSCIGSSCHQRPGQGPREEEDKGYKVSQPNVIQINKK